jgi:hypothetical protein
MLTALTVAAVAVPAQVASATAPARSQTVASSQQIAPTTEGIPVALTESEAASAGLSSDHTTAMNLDTGGRVLLTPMPGDTATADFHTQKRWWRITVFFNKRETLILATGTAACANFAGRIPQVGWAIAMYCGALSIYAGYVAAKGRCVRVTHIATVTAPWWGAYRGRWCR